MAGYDDALAELYRAPLAQFVAERKRIAGELKRDGDAGGAKELLARKRPTISAWVVNQLYWHARDAFDDMLKTAERLRKGDLRASGDHRDAIAKLRKRAAAFLEDAGHNASESTLRRVTTTLAALAATGGFDPDPPGTLAEDRDPPGFEAIGIPLERTERTDRAERPAAKAPATKKRDRDEEKAEAEEAARRRAEEIAEKKRAEAERKRIAIERHKLESALRTAKADRSEREREVKHAEKQLEKAREAVEKAEAVVGDIEARLAELEGN